MDGTNRIHHRQIIAVVVTDSLFEHGVGFLANTKVRIPVPKSLELVHDGLRTMGRADIADDFLESMNRAAERAVPEAAVVVTGVSREMTRADARGILEGG